MKGQQCKTVQAYFLPEGHSAGWLVKGGPELHPWEACRMFDTAAKAIVLRDIVTGDNKDTLWLLRD